MVRVALPCLEAVRGYDGDAVLVTPEMASKTEVGCAHSVADVTTRTTWSCVDSCVSASTAIFCSLVVLSHEYI